MSCLIFSNFNFVKFNFFSDIESVINDVTITDDNPVMIDLDSSSDSIKVYNSIEEFDRNLPQTVTLLKTPTGSRVYLVGTAHFSKESQDDVSLVR